MQTQTIANLVKNQSINDITPYLFNKDLDKSILLFTILSLNPNRSAFKLMNLNDIIISPNLLSSKIKSCINDITKINEFMKTITYAEIKDFIDLTFFNFSKFGNQYILPQILLSEFYKNLGLKYLIIESFNNRTNNLIGFSNYIKFNKKFELITNQAEKTLIKEKYKNFNISKLETYPDFLIVNEWENNYYIDKELYEYPDKCDILDGKNMDKFTYKLFEKHQYKLISCIATNYTDPAEKLDEQNRPHKINLDNINKHTIIYLIDENNSVYVYTNREFSYNIQRKGYIFTENKKIDLVCNKIYQLPKDDTYKYEFSFNKEKCELKKGAYENSTFNFSMKKGNRTFIYFRQPQPPVAPPPAPPVVVPAPGTKDPHKSPPQVKSRDSIDNFGSIDNELKKYLKEIKFKDNLNEIKKKINYYYYNSSRKLATKIVEDNNDEIYKENNNIMKNKIHNKYGNKNLQTININKISSCDKKNIAQKIEKDIEKQRKSLDMKIHIFLTMSFQIMISKIKSKAEKELYKKYKSEVNNELRKLNKAYNKHSSSASSFKSASSPKPAGPPIAPPAPAGPPIASPKLAGPAPAPPAPLAPGPPKPSGPPAVPHTGKKGKKKK